MKKYRWPLAVILWCGILLFLLLASYTDLIFHEKETSIYNVVFLLDNDKKDVYDDMIAGIKKYDVKNQLKVYYYSTGDYTSAQELAEGISDAAADRSLIIARCDSDPLIEEALAICDLPEKTLLLHPAQDTSQGFAVIRADAAACAEQMADKILSEYPDQTVYVFTSGGLDSAREAGVSTLQAAGLKTVVYLEKDMDTLEKTVKSLCEGADPVFLGMDADTTIMIATALKSLGLKAPLYGFGYDPDVLKKVEDGEIDGICMSSEYYLGYETAKLALEKLDENRRPGDVTLETYCLDRANMFSPEYEKMLFPQ